MFVIATITKKLQKSSISIITTAAARKSINAAVSEKN
jgi:hypothetical protein